MRRGRLRGRLLLLVALAVLPAFVVIILTAMEQRRAAMAQAQSHALELASHVAEQQRAAIEAGRHLLIALARLPTVRARDAAPCSRTFADVLKEFPRYTGLFAATPGGDIFCGAPAVTGPVSLAGRPAFERAVTTGRFVVSLANRSSITGKAIVILGQPALDDAGNVVAFVTAGLHLAWLSDGVRRAGLPPTTELLVVDEKGTIVLALPETLGAVGRSAASLQRVQAALAAAPGATRSRGRDGVDRVIGFTAFGEPGARLFVIASVPEAAVLATATTALWRNLGVLAAVALGAFAVAWYGAGFLIVRPLRDLVAATRRLAGGDLTARAVPSPIEEIGGLAEAFNEMSATLAATQTALSARLRDSAALLAVARVLGGIPDLGESLRMITRELAQLTGADTVSAFLVTHDRALLRPIAAYHVPKDALDELGAAELALGDLQFPAELLEGGRVQWSSDVQADPRFGNAIFRKFPHQSAAMMPLQLDGETWGAFYLNWWTAERRFEPDELALLQGISEEVGVLMRTVRLHQEAEARRRIAEAAKERYRLLFERNLAGVFRSSRDGRIIECNDAFARLNGFASRDDAVAHSARDLYADPAERDALLQRLDDERRIQNFEMRARRANGDEYWALLNISKVNDGSGEYLEGIVMDISDRKHAEQAAREVSALRSVTVLANAAAHEINNPLAVMVGHLDREAARTTDEATRVRLGKVRAAAQRIREIVARMHHITRVEIAPDPPGLPDRLDLERSGDLP